MNEKLTVVMGGEPVIEYDRGKVLSDSQLEYLHKVDVRMAQGFKLGGVQIDEPDQLQRAQFMALHLVEALKQGDDGRVAASCGYLAIRIPDLKQVKVLNGPEGSETIDLVFDKPYAPQATVQFIDPKAGN